MARYYGENRVVVDWDGTCVPQEWPGHPTEWTVDPATGLTAKDFMRACLEAGMEVVISSTRLSPKSADDEVSPLPRADRDREARYIRRTLDAAGLQDVQIWRRPWKPGALFYVDDKAVKFDGDWTRVLKEVLP